MAIYVLSNVKSVNRGSLYGFV